MTVFFNSTIAKEYGTNAAILLQSIYGWIRFNKRNGTNYHDGRYWTYSSRKAFADTFTFISERTIWATLKKLCEDGLLLTGNYNASSYDRTTWYALSDKGEALMQKAEMDCAETSQSNEQEPRNGTAQVAQSNAQEHTDNTIIENIIEDIVEPFINNNPPIIPPRVDAPTSRSTIDYSAIQQMYNETCPSLRQVRNLSDSRKKAIKARLSSYTLDDMRTVFEKAEASTFLKGGNDRNWSADFDWLIKDSSFVKVLDGKYDDEQPSKPATLTLGENVTRPDSAAAKAALYANLNAQLERMRREDDEKRGIGG